ncbi:phosphate acetyltransferase [Actinomyces capricornis]|uniref:Phosphate acetyltransferase n=1 Tax=Actinomyces capricornis TaxID=2755559 RepID=A0ABM7UMF8_9ACTO|nr:phosphate acetyltransferase [Actinomyces capricornis]BDA64899.1 phosphate acetyltransferase [Actinomyces capricornis]
MARSIYIASPNAGTGKSTVALGLVASLTKVVAKVGVFRPFVESRDNDDFLNLLLARSGSTTAPELCVGATWDEFHADPEESLSRIVSAYRTMAREHDVVIIDGSDFTDVVGNPELELNARVAANIDAPILLVVSGAHDPEDVVGSVEVSIAEIADNHARTVAVVANKCRPETRQAVAQALAGIEGVASTTLPEVPLLAAPSVREVMANVQGTLIAGDPALLEREAESVLVCAMDVSHVLERLSEGQLAIVPADRSAVLISLAAAQASSSFPVLSGLVLNGGFQVAPHAMRLLEGLGISIPVIASPLDTFEAASISGSLRGLLAHGSERKLDVAVTTFEQEADVDALLAALEVEPSGVVTPIMFQAELVERSRAERKTIVLPEPDDDRVLRAADAILRRGIADLVLLGDETAVRARAAELGLDIAAARVVSTEDPELLEKYAAEFARLRAKKGVTLEDAREKVQDVSYFGTMMVHMGDADGMVSGAAHTTAHTIVPSFQIIKTQPGTSIVSSVFLMLLEDRVLVYGDCAVNPEPTAEQLADIAISSAATAVQFGVEPRVAMLSFSTGASGQGADVDKVREATELVRAKAPELAVDGPIQYDAAVDPTVAAKKAPGSAVAGRANVLIFPDLSSGNIGYKAVQRSSGAIAVGPVLQGLNKPVNDLSRGALVEDIINTVAITAVQAQG